MVPARSHKVSRVSWYSGSCFARSPFVYGAFTLSGWLSQNHSTRLTHRFCSPNPGVHALRFGLFPFRSPLLWKSHVVFSSSGYLDVSVHRVPLLTLWIGVRITEGCSVRFPHSEISGSMDICSSPRLFAACHVLLRLLMPRHSPCALSSLTYRRSHSDLSENSWFSLRIMQALQRSKLYVTLHPFGCCSTINLFPLCLHRETSLLPYLLLSHCSVFKVQIAVRKLPLVSGTASNRFCSQI